ANFKGWKFWSPDTKHTIVSNSVVFDERYHPGTSKSPIDLSVPWDPVEAGGNKCNQVEFNLPQSPPLLPPAPPAPPPVTAPSPSPSPSPKPSPPAPKLPLPPSSPPAPSTPDPLNSLKCERSISVGSSPPRKYRIVDNPPPPPPLPTPAPGPLHNSFRDRDMVGNPLRGLHGYHIPQPPTTVGPDFDQYRESSIDPLDVMLEEEEEELLAQEMPYDLHEALDVSGCLSSTCEVTLRTCEDYHYLTWDQACEHVYRTTNHFEEAMSASERSQFGPEPKHWKDMLKRPDSAKCIQAASEEIQALVHNGTWTVEPLPHGRKAVGCRWVFKLKQKADGSIDRYKARLVAKGFSQRPGMDFDQTFSPTAKWAALRTILALAALEDLCLFSVDISNAFLNGDMEHEVYMDLPEGYKQLGLGDATSGYALRLVKALYGLKQAGRQWHRKLNAALVAMGFVKVSVDHAIWVYRQDDTRVIIPAYVDDMLIATKETSKAEAVIEELGKHFKLHNLGPTSFLLGVQINRDRSKCLLTLSQHQYVLDILDQYNMSDCSPVTTPMDSNAQLSKEQSPKTDSDINAMKAYPYAQLVRSLMYLAICTRPDIAYAVGVLGQFSSNPGMAHWRAAKHLLHYLKGTVDLKLEYAPDSSQSELFTAYCDANHAGNRDNCRLQLLVTLSTTEAEYISAVMAGQEILWLCNLLTEFGYSFDHASTLFVDNQSAIQVANNPEHRGRMKHLDLRFYWLRDQVEAGALRLVHMRTADMPADLLTKSLGRNKVQDLRGLVGLVGDARQ
ncbi:hypothetical protein M0805_004183, partial [Coniferiporia weirii]